LPMAGRARRSAPLRIQRSSGPARNSADHREAVAQPAPA
jgi:hypothetical protein